MNKTLLIFRHEFRATAGRVGFICLTLALPVLALLAIGVFHVASGQAQPPAKVTEIGYVDQSGVFDQFTNRGTVSLVRYDSLEAATEALVGGSIAECFVIPPDFIASGMVQRYTMRREATMPPATRAAIEDFISSNLLAGRVSADEAARIQQPLNFVSTRLAATGEVASEQVGLVNLIIPGVFCLLLALSLSFSSTYVLQGLGEEKENRLIEILLSSVSSRQLITGKLLGIGAAGLLQVVVWVVSIPVLLSLASSSIGGILTTIQIPPHFLALGVAYFVLGYGLFAVFSAGVAAVSPTVRDAQGLASIFAIFAIAPFWFYSLLLMFPDSPVWVVFSIFPFSSPVLVMLRVGMTGVPAWQLVASLAVLALSVAGGALLGAKLLRTYLLMYGKRPRLGAIVRSLRSG